MGSRNGSIAACRTRRLCCLALTDASLGTWNLGTLERKWRRKGLKRLISGAEMGLHGGSRSHKMGALCVSVASPRDIPLAPRESSEVKAAGVLAALIGHLVKVARKWHRKPLKVLISRSEMAGADRSYKMSGCAGPAGQSIPSARERLRIKRRVLAVLLDRMGESRPEMAAQRIEKIDSAPGNGMAREAAPQGVGRLTPPPSSPPSPPP